MSHVSWITRTSHRYRPATIPPVVSKLSALNTVYCPVFALASMAPPNSSSLSSSISPSYFVTHRSLKRAGPLIIEPVRLPVLKTVQQCAMLCVPRMTHVHNNLTVCMVIGPTEVLPSRLLHTTHQTGQAAV